MEETYLKLAKIFKSLSDPKRIRILDMLADGEKCACVLLEHFQISQPTLSHDLKQLIEAGIVNSRREGQRIFYSLNMDMLQAMQHRLKKIIESN